MKAQNESYKIRQVIDLTGASEFLLRTWENRYFAFTPARTKTGRRLYSANDVLKVRALMTLTEQGFRVGEIAPLSLPELNQLIKQHVTDSIKNNIDPRVKKIITLANQFSWEKVRSAIHLAAEKQTPIDWIHSIIIPLVVEMSRQVDAGFFSIVHEHILSAIIKESLAVNTQRKAPIKHSARLVFAAPEGDYHDIGLLIASFIANELGAETLFLGSHMPKNELSAVCMRFKATHLVLTSTASKEDGAKDDYLSYLNFLDNNLNPKITLWLAGRNAQKYPTSLSRSFNVFNSFKSFETELRNHLK